MAESSCIDKYTEQRSTAIGAESKFLEEQVPRKSWVGDNASVVAKTAPEQRHGTNWEPQRVDPRLPVWDQNKHPNRDAVTTNTYDDVRNATGFSLPDSSYDRAHDPRGDLYNLRDTVNFIQTNFDLLDTNKNGNLEDRELRGQNAPFVLKGLYRAAYYLLQPETLLEVWAKDFGMPRPTKEKLSGWNGELKRYSNCKRAEAKHIPEEVAIARWGLSNFEQMDTLKQGFVSRAQIQQFGKQQHNYYDLTMSGKVIDRMLPEVAPVDRGLGYIFARTALTKESFRRLEDEELGKKTGHLPCESIYGGLMDWRLREPY